MFLKFRPAFTLLLAIAISGCVSTPQTAALIQQPPDSMAAKMMLQELPFFPQEQYQCGPAALATLLAAARSLGRVAYKLEPSLGNLLAEINAGYPVLVLQNLGLNWYPQWHFAVVKGYDLNRKEIVLNSGTRENYTVPLSTFEETWHRAGRWAALVLEPGQLPATANPSAYFNALVEYAHNNHGDESIGQAYQTALTRWPMSSGLLMGYANLLYSQGNLHQSADYFRALIHRQPDYAAAYNNLAQVQYELGQRESALELAEKALAPGGEHRQTYLETLIMIQNSP